MSSADALEQLTGLFVRLGAGPESARVMAAQLLKRAGQVAREQGIAEEAALAQLLEKVAAGRRGDYRPPP